MGLYTDLTLQQSCFFSFLPSTLFFFYASHIAKNNYSHHGMIANRLVDLQARTEMTEVSVVTFNLKLFNIFMFSTLKISFQANRSLRFADTGSPHVLSIVGTQNLICTDGDFEILTSNHFSVQNCR